MKRILVTAAGGANANNLIKGLLQADKPYFIVGCNIESSYLATSLAQKNYLIPGVESGSKYIKALNHIVNADEIDLIIPSIDLEVGFLSNHRDKVLCKLWLPNKRTIKICQDKFQLHKFLLHHKFPTAKTFQINKLEDIKHIFSEFQSRELLWCRMRTGGGSKGSLPVRTAEQATSWIKYWHEMRKVPVSQFTLSEYLPGRDFAFQSLWKNGNLIIAKTLERLDYLYSGIMASGTSSTPRTGKLVNDERVNKICSDVISALEPYANGIFCVDLKENQEGIPIITEINIGRFFQITPVFNETGKYNMAEIYVKLAFDEMVSIIGTSRFSDIGDESYYYLREPDRNPMIISQKDLNNCYINLVQ